MAAGDITKAMSVELSKRIADEAATYDLDGSAKLFTSAGRLSAINEARKKIYGNLLQTMGMDKFIEMFPEFVCETDRSTAVAANVGTWFAGARKFITVKLVRLTSPAGTYDGTYLCRRLPKEVYYEMQLNQASCPFETSGSDYGFIEINGAIRFFGEISGVITGTYYGIYLKDVVDIAYTEDGPEPGFWKEDIIEEAAKILLSKSSNK